MQSIRYDVMPSDTVRGTSTLDSHMPVMRVNVGPAMIANWRACPLCVWLIWHRRLPRHRHQVQVSKACFPFFSSLSSVILPSLHPSPSSSRLSLSSVADSVWPFCLSLRSIPSLSTFLVSCLSWGSVVNHSPGRYRDRVLISCPTRQSLARRLFRWPFLAHFAVHGL